MLDVNSPNIGNPSESDAIDQAIPPPTNGINIYFVHRFDASAESRNVRGFATPINGHAVYVPDITSSGEELLITIAHEIGHALGLAHPSENPNIANLNCGGPRKNFCNPYVTANDSDRTDAKALMWWSAAPSKGCHLGSPAWFELNANNPLREQ